MDVCLGSVSSVGDFASTSDLGEGSIDSGLIDSSWFRLTCRVKSTNVPPTMSISGTMPHAATKRLMLWIVDKMTMTWASSLTVQTLCGL